MLKINMKLFYLTKQKNNKLKIIKNIFFYIKNITIKYIIINKRALLLYILFL